MQLNFRLYFGVTLFLIPIFILSACTPGVSTNFPQSTLPLQSQTPFKFTATPQPTESPIQPSPTKSVLQARLAAVKFSAKVFRGGESETTVQQAQTVMVHVNDRIEVVKLEEQNAQSHSILDFPNRVQVELFGNTEVLLTDMREAAEGASEITLNLTQGHVFVNLIDQTFTQVTVATPFSTIRTLEINTELDVCHNEELTCVVVKRGAVEIQAQGTKEIVKAGAASYVLKDQGPVQSICASPAIFMQWEENFRRLANTLTLDKKVFQLQKTLCTSTSVELPSNARKLYQDLFSNASSGWEKGKIDNYLFDYSEPDYYQVQVQSPEDKLLVSEPNKTPYGAANVDIKAFTASASDGDFRYGVVFRRSGDQYYAFAISPRTKSWYFLKSSSDNSLEILKEGTEEGIQGPEIADALRLEARGSTFYFYINGRFIDLVRDSDYTNGEVGFFVQTIDSPDVLIHFDSIVIWDIPAPSPVPTRAKENCYNSKDDDGDGSIDRADADCEIQARTATPESPTNIPPTNIPTTQPPATEPPATEPPATEPPATQPPPTDPPPTEPPATDPPVTEPPATEPPATQPP